MDQATFVGNKYVVLEEDVIWALGQMKLKPCRASFDIPVPLLNGCKKELAVPLAIIFNIILAQQLLDLETGIPLSNRVAPAGLTSSQRDRLSWALEQVPNVSNLLGDPLSQ